MTEETEPATLEEAIAYFSDPERAFLRAVEMRWPGGRIACPRCGTEEPSFLERRRIWFCRGCRRQFSLKVGTIFEDSPLGMDRWMLALWMVAYSREGLTSYTLARALGITQKSAWLMLRRIGKAQERWSLTRPGAGGDAGKSAENSPGGTGRTRRQGRAFDRPRAGASPAAAPLPEKPVHGVWSTLFHTVGKGL